MIGRIVTALTWLQWAMLATLVLAIALCMLAWIGLAPGQELERRPTPLPRRRPDARGRHALDGRPPGGRLDWLGGTESQGWWIWREDDDPR